MSTGKLKWSPKKRATAIVLRREGYTYQQIADKIGGGTTSSGAYRICKKFLNFNTIKDLPGRGRKKKTTVQDDRRIVRLSLQDRRLPSKDIRDTLNSSGVNISSRTVRRRLCEKGLHARRPRKKPYLNVKQRKKRLVWAQGHRNWTVEQWGRVLFSDECQISIFGHSGVRYVRRRPGEEMLPICTIPTMKHPLSVMVWGCMAKGGVGRLQVINGTVNAEKYVTEILACKLLQSANDVFGQETSDRRQFVFQQDSAPCHSAKRSMQWLKDEGVEVLDWPGNSPDLNPIENLWSRLKRLVSARKPSNRTELITAIINAWFRVITTEQLGQLVDSMPRRCEAVIKAKGFPTKY
jgi:transposase